MEWIIGIILIIVVWTVIAAQLKEKRRKALFAKYGDKSIVQKIMTKTIWMGQTEEQLRDSIGKPVAMDTSVLKTKTKDVWKYDREGQNRYALRIIVENGLVAGWKHKGG